MKKLLAAGFLTLLLAACGQAVPPEKAAYVGQWKGPQMSLSISQSGKVQYERHTESSKTSVNAPLQGFNGDNFDVGLAGMTTTFVVTVPPHADGDATKMTVDGVELVKVN